MIKVMLCETGDLRDLRRQGYVCEEKYDGTRAIIEKVKGTVKIYNRHGIDYTRRLPDIVAVAESTPGDFTVDAEVVYINPHTGKVEFTPCQRRCATSDWIKVHYLLQQFPLTAKNFDILSLNDESTVDMRYLERKDVLSKLLEKAPSAMQYVPYRFDLEQAFEEVKQRQEEGLIIKNVDSRYMETLNPSKRSYEWMKIKNWRPPETCNVVGFTPGDNARSAFFGSLVLVRDGKFRGCVGSGFNDWELRLIKDKLSDAPAIDRPFDIGEPYTAVRTNLKVAVKYYKITENNVMRFPLFEGVIE